jgi:hypothetical protein
MTDLLNQELLQKDSKNEALLEKLQKKEEVAQDALM